MGSMYGLITYRPGPTFPRPRPLFGTGAAFGAGDLLFPLPLLPPLPSLPPLAAEAGAAPGKKPVSESKEETTLRIWSSVGLR